MAKISSRHALNEEEYEFCIKIAAGLTQTEAYRRAYGTGSEDAKAVAKKASNLAKQPHIKAYLVELRGDVADLARGTFVDQLVSDGKNTSTLLGAARAILDDEALQQERDDLEKYWMVAAACGAEVVAMVGDEEVAVPLTELMPKFKDATPPPEVLEKTAKSLEEWYTKLCEKEEELDERDRQDHGS
jgi:hypothetical protein